ncbi:MAG: hypothetical protein K0U29_09165 [Gammaproteobacteria bacterium]|nr:hypothetical protein [Gammaproteobacteria bacterium]
MAKSERESPEKKLSKGPCPVGYTKKALSPEQQKAMPGYHRCVPVSRNKLNLYMTASQGVMNTERMPRFFFKTLDLVKGVDVTPQPLTKLGKMSILYYQNQKKGRLATILAYCKPIAEGDNNNFIRYDVDYNGEDIQLKNLHRIHNYKDNGSGCVLDLHKFPYINYKNATTHFASVNYVYDVPVQCPAGAVKGKHGCECPKGLLLDEGACVSPKNKQTMNLNFNFKSISRGINYVPGFDVSMKPVPRQRQVSFSERNLNGSGHLFVHFTQNSLGALAGITAKCEVNNDTTGRQVHFSVNYDGRKVYFVPRLDIEREPSGKQCDLYLYQNKMPQVHYWNGEYRVHVNFVYSLGKGLMRKSSVVHDSASIPVTLGYTVGVNNILRKERVCLPGNTYITYLKHVGPGQKNSVFKTVKTADLRKPLRADALKVWRWNFVYNVEHPERAVGQSIEIHGNTTCNNLFCGRSYCVNGFTVKYVVKQTSPLVLQCVPGRYRDVCDDVNVCKGIRCTPRVVSRGGPVRIQCMELGPYNCRDQ